MDDNPLSFHSYSIPTNNQTIMRPNSSIRRNRPSPSFFKQLQTILGPRLATQFNCALFIIFIQVFIIFFLSLSIIAKNNLIASYGLNQRSSFYQKTLKSTYNNNLSTFNDVQEQPYGMPAPENQDLVPEALDNTDYDDMSPAVTGLSRPLKYTTFFGRFTRCKPKPCNINHWSYVGDKCYYRDDNVKDRAGHNSSIWKLIQHDWYYTIENDFACPVSVCRHQWKNELNLTEHIVLRALQEHYQNETVWELERMYMGNKYVRVNQFWGLEYKLHGGFTLTKTDENGKEVHESKNATITIRRGFTQKYCDVSVNSNVQSAQEPIYVIVPYTGRIEQLRLFFENVKDLLDAGVALRVILATHGGPVHLLGAAELLREMQIGFSEGELADGHIVQVVETMGDSSGKFSRSKALLDGSLYAPADALLFFCDVDMIIKPQFFENCRYNTQRNYQVYYPVVYSLYPYGKIVSKEHGYWRSGAFGMVCVYKSDFKRTKKWKMYQTSLNGWGMEDTLLYKEFTMHWQTSIFHAVEPNLLHRWHPKYCEFNAHIAACLGTVFQNMGSQKFLAAIVADSGIDIRAIRYNPAPVTFELYKNDTAGTKERQLEVPAAESETDTAKMEDLRKIYEASLSSEKGGLLAVFAKEALDTLAQANTQAVTSANSHIHPAQARSTLTNTDTTGQTQNSNDSGIAQQDAHDTTSTNANSESSNDSTSNENTSSAAEGHDSSAQEIEPNKPEVPMN